MPTFTINALDVTLQVDTDCPFIFENLAKDFSLFPKASGLPQVRLNIFVQKPPYERIPPVEANIHAPGLICYKNNTTNYITYSLGGLLIYDFANEKGELYGENEAFIYEKAKLTLLSRLGELLDRRGLQRIHAFAAGYGDKNMICLLPMEGGKTTTIINLLKSDPGLKIIADDVCIIDRQGMIYPFLLRIGVRHLQLTQGISPEFVVTIDRPISGTKYFIEPSFFKDRLANQKRPVTHVFIGKRVFRQETTIEKISKTKCIGPIMESGVFGLGLPQLIGVFSSGLPQLLEFFNRGDVRLLWRKSGVMLSKVFSCLRLIRKTKTYTIKIGLDEQASCQAILNFLKNG